MRARIGALAWIAERVARARPALARAQRAAAARDRRPDANEEYLLYQTLVGAWPIEPERLEAYLEKALREAKRNTNWIEPDEEWESAVKRFARGCSTHEPFLDDFEPVRRRGRAPRASARRSARSC